MTDGQPPLAAVTGGTGFLGRYVVQALVRDGWRVRLLVRHSSAPPPLPAGSPPAEVVRGDLGDAAALRRLVEGARAVVHVAGLTKARREAEFLAVNRDGTARLAAATAASATRFVLVSSMAAREPRLSPYAASKRAGEDAAVSALGDGGGRVSWAVLRPSVIYGPWDREGLALLRMARAPVAPVPRAPEPRIAMVHAADAAAAVVALCRDGAPAGARFEVTDARHAGYGWRELLRLLSGVAGRGPPRFVPVPDGALLAAGAAADAWGAATGRASLFGRGKAREILHRDWGSAPERQPPPALWAPRIDLEAGLRGTLDWWRGVGGFAARA